MAGNNCLSRFNIFRRNKQPKQEFPNGEKANLVPPDDTVKKLPTKTELSQSPQTELQTQHAHSMSIAGHEQTMASSTGDITQEDSAHHRSAALIQPRILWDRAYDSLREDQPRLVEAYEKALSCELAAIPTVSPTSNINVQQNLIEQENTETRQSQMKQLVDKGLAKTEHEAKVKQEMGDPVDIVLKLKDMIGTAVKPCPEAALAWTGVVFALQVSVVSLNCRIPS